MWRSWRNSWGAVMVRRNSCGVGAAAAAGGRRRSNLESQQRARLLVEKSVRLRGRACGAALCQRTMKRSGAVPAIAAALLPLVAAHYTQSDFTAVDCTLGIDHYLAALDAQCTTTTPCHYDPPRRSRSCASTRRAAAATRRPRPRPARCSAPPTKSATSTPTAASSSRGASTAPR